MCNERLIRHRKEKKEGIDASKMEIDSLELEIKDVKSHLHDKHIRLDVLQQLMKDSKTFMFSATLEKEYAHRSLEEERQKVIDIIQEVWRKPEKKTAKERPAIPGLFDLGVSDRSMEYAKAIKSIPEKMRKYLNFLRDEELEMDEELLKRMKKIQDILSKQT